MAPVASRPEQILAELDAPIPTDPPEEPPAIIAEKAVSSPLALF